MNWLDIIIIVCVGIGIVHGITTGIVKQVISLVALVAAVLLSGIVAKGIQHWIQTHIQNAPQWFSPGIQNVIYYVLAFILIISIFSIAAHLIDKIINHTPVGILNRLFGAIFGALMWALCLSIALNILAVFDNQSQVIPKQVKEESVCYERVKMIFPTIFPYIIDFLKHEANG